MSAETKTLAEDFNDYESMWKDSASWVTASGNKINSSNNTNNKYKEKLQKLIDYHITDTATHDAKAHGRWKPTANMNIKALDETADSAFLTFTETCYRGQAGVAEERMIDAFYDKQTKKFKILFFLNKKLIVRKEGTSFNDMMEELCFFFRSPKFGTPERQDLMEWVDKNGTNIALNGVSTTPTGKSATTGPTKIHDLRDKYDKLVSHLRSMYSLKVNRRTAQLLDVDIKVGTKFKNKLIVTYDYQKGCLVGALYDEFGREVSSNNCWGGWSVLIAWLKKEGFPLIDHLCENNSDKESCKFPFSKEDLDAALNNLTDEDEPGLELGDNFENSDVLTVAGEPYGGTKWYVDKWADNFYIITSELWGQDGGGPEEGVYEELDSIDEVWDYLNKLDPLSGVPTLKSKKTESMLTDYKYEEFKEYETMRDSLTETSHSTKLSKLTPEEYFKNITQSKEAVIKFIREKLVQQTKIKPNGYFDISSSYARVLARETSGNHVEIGKNLNYNYKAFTKESSKFGLFASNILHYIKTGELFISAPYEET